jgi:Mg/Co/Ni transporter MgtE
MKISRRARERIVWIAVTIIAAVVTLVVLNHFEDKILTSPAEQR